ncbi:class I SAM-dependent methyltransferase [Planctomycetota bacterium]|nr:class I SAM-dependent methyltransferase [Planctomycetota bacterium]
MRYEKMIYKDNDSRSKYVVDRYAEKIKGKVLDIGCYDRGLEKALPEGVEYLGIDFVGEPDIKVNLDEKPELPFEDGEFDAVVCTEVLEHLDKLYKVWDEIVRVANKTIVISLPNCWRTLRRPIEKGEGNVLYYGLPADEAPDRHRWFFNCADIEGFFVERAKRQGLKVLDVYAVGNRRGALKESVRKLLSGSHDRYVNRYANSVWVIMEKE